MSRFRIGAATLGASLLMFPAAAQASSPPRTSLLFDPDQGSLGGIRLVGSLAAVVLWFSYFGLLALEKGIGWKPTTWIGVVVIGIGTGFGTSFLIAPPAYGPRLVEGGEDLDLA